MERLFDKIIKREDVQDLVSEVISNNRYKRVDIPMSLDNNYFFDDKYALFLLLDAFIKYDIIIYSEKYLEEYISQIKRLFKRIYSYQDITKGINKILASYCAKVLDISNCKTVENKEKILRYVYKKYIVEGYFYYGFSSCSSNEIDFSGIKKDGFILDSRIDDINTILRKYENRDIIKRVKSDITDNFVIASYFALLGPDYLEKLANSGILIKDIYDKDCFFNKNVNLLIKNMQLFAKNNHINTEDTNIILKNLYNVLIEENVEKSNGVIAFVKRSYLNKNYLKNIEEIISGSREQDIESSLSMIMESRYSCYDIDSDISPLYLEYLYLPSYNELCKNTIQEKTDANIVEILTVDDDYKLVEEKQQKSKKVSNSYGFISIFMLILLIIIVVVTVLFIIKGMGVI